MTTLDARAHAEHLAPGVHAALARAGAAPTDVTDVVVGIGPGPFTGLRVGIVTGRIFAFALGVPVRGLTSLDALAHEAWLGGRRGDLLVATDARRKEVYAAAYVLGDTAARRVTGPLVARASDLAAGLRELPAVGRGALLYPDSLPVPVEPVDVSAGALADLAVRRLAEQAGADDRWRPGGTRRGGRHTAARRSGWRVRRSRAALPSTPGHRSRPAEPEVDPRVSAATPLPAEATPDGVTLRELEWTDLPVLATLERELFADDAWSEQTWWAELAGRPRRDYVVALIDDAVAGYAGLDVAGEIADVMTVATAPAHQGRGIGRLLLHELVRRAVDRGCRALLLEVRADNAAARALYERNGFEVISVRRRYYQPGDVDALVMRRVLTRGDP